MCVCVFVFTVQLSTNYQQEPATPTTTPEATTTAATTTTTTSHLCVQQQQQQQEIPRDFPPALCVSATIHTHLKGKLTPKNDVNMQYVKYLIATLSIRNL